MNPGSSGISRKNSYILSPSQFTGEGTLSRVTGGRGEAMTGITPQTRCQSGAIKQPLNKCLPRAKLARDYHTIRDACRFLQSLRTRIYLSNFSYSPCSHSQPPALPAEGCEHLQPLQPCSRGSRKGCAVRREGLSPSSARTAQEELSSQQTPVNSPSLHSCSLDSN